MAFTSKLAELFVEFSVKGIKGVESGISAVGKSILGFAAAGLIGTTEGNALKTSVQLLSREITSAFLPAIHTAIAGVQQITGFMQRLSGEQQDAIMKWGGAAIAVASFGKALQFMGIAATGPLGIMLSLGAAVVSMALQTEKGQASFARLYEAMSKVVDLVGPKLIGLFEKIADLLIDEVVGAIEKVTLLLELLAKGMELVGLKSSQVAGGGRKEHRSVTVAGGGTEGLIDSYRRLQSAVNQIDYPKLQLDVSQKQLIELQQIKQATAGKQPAFAV